MSERLLCMPLIASMLLLGGCGGDDDESESQNTNAAEVNEAAVTQTANLAYSATQTAVNGDGQASAFQMLSVGTSAIAFVTPTMTQPASRAPFGEVSQAVTTGMCECTENSCTFTDCGGDTAAAGFTLTGTISWSATSLDCDYTVSGEQAGQSYNFSVFCDLDYTETSLAGTLQTSGDIDVMAQGQSANTTWDTTLVFNQVTFSAQTATGGSIEVTATVSVNGQSYAGNSTVTLGG